MIIKAEVEASKDCTDASDEGENVDAVKADSD